MVEINNDAAKPSVSTGKILVEVRAAGVNPADWKIRQGYWQKAAPLEFPAILGGDFSGVVVEVGGGVSGFKKGDEVYGSAIILAGGSGGSGSFAEFALAAEINVSLKPKKANFIEAAALPLAAVSALEALLEHLNLKNGQKTLIHGAAGGIGSFAVQLAKHLGAYVAATASAESVDFVKKLGADEVVDYKSQKFEEILKNFDAVFDTVGADTYTRSFKVLKKGGVLVSMLEQPNQELMKQYGVNAILQFTQVDSKRLKHLAELFDQGVIKVNVDKVFPLEEAGQALSYLEKGHPRGKVVIEIKKIHGG